jgi:hypothetical protein
MPLSPDHADFALFTGSSTGTISGYTFGATDRARRTSHPTQPDRHWVSWAGAARLYAHGGLKLLRQGDGQRLDQLGGLWR